MRSWAHETRLDAASGAIWAPSAGAIVSWVSLLGGIAQAQYPNIWYYVDVPGTRCTIVQ